MGPKVLALIENSIGVRLTLAARLTDLGFQVTIVTAPEAFAERIHGETFDWIFLDDAAVPAHRRRFFAHLAENRRSAHVVWCGERPRNAPVRIEAIFDKPLRYDDVRRFFSRWAVAGRPESADGGARQAEAPQATAGDSTAASAAPVKTDGGEATGGGEE